MWAIIHKYSGDKFYFLPEVEKYVVGRVGSDIILSGDTSISRSHAVFHNTNSSLTLEDMNSKYGTYYIESDSSRKKLANGSAIELKEGDQVLFGALKNEWLISKICIKTMVSSVNGTQLSDVKELLNLLGGIIISDWEPSCTHLTMSEITITLKVLHALIEEIPIVSCEFWKHYLKEVRCKKSPPKESLFLPRPSSTLSPAIDLGNFKINNERKKLFCGKTFVFMSKKHFDMYSPIVIKAGGECKDLKSKTSKSFLLRKNVITIQHTASTQSQNSQTMDIISEYLALHSLRTVPEYEIGLAIVCCTTENYCNPMRSTLIHILPHSQDTSVKTGSLLVKNTHPEVMQTNNLELPAVEIPDSGSYNNKPFENSFPQSDIFEDNIESTHSLQNQDKKKGVTLSPEINPNDHDKNNKSELKSRSSSKRKRNSKDDYEVWQTAKRNQISPSKLDSEPSSENCDITKDKTAALPAKKDTRTQQIHSHEPILSLMPNLPENSKTGNSTVKNRTQERTKRCRLVCISDDEDDVFNFGSSSKIAKTNLSEETDPRNIVEKSDLQKTQPFVVHKKSYSKMNAENLNISPMAISNTDWLSKSTTLKIESNVNYIETKNETDEQMRTEWIKSFKGGFDVKTLSITIAPKEVPVTKKNCNATVNNSKMNFKTFVKKHNYKDQTLVIKTVPLIISPTYI